MIVLRFLPSFGCSPEIGKGKHFNNDIGQCKVVLVTQQLQKQSYEELFLPPTANGFTQKISELKRAPLSPNWLINTQGFMKITLEIYLIRNNSLLPFPFFLFLVNRNIFFVFSQLVLPLLKRSGLFASCTSVRWRSNECAGDPVTQLFSYVII